MKVCKSSIVLRNELFASDQLKSNGILALGLHNVIKQFLLFTINCKIHFSTDLDVTAVCWTKN